MEIIIEITGNRYRGEILDMALPVIKRPDELQLFGKKFKLIEEPDTKMIIDLKELFPIHGIEKFSKEGLGKIKEMLWQYLIDGRCISFEKKEVICPK